MCKALEDLYAEGKAEGVNWGVLKRNRELILKNHAVGMTDEAIAEFLLMPVEMIKQIIKEGTVETV